MDFNVVFAFVSVAVCVATYFGGKLSAAKAEAKCDEGRLARLEFKLDSVKSSVDEIKTDYKSSIKWLHKRLDDHLRNEHKITLPNREE